MAYQFCMNGPSYDPARIWSLVVGKGLPEHGVLLVVEVAGQRLQVVRNGAVERSFPVSTSRHGTGQRENSFRTPLGLHEVADRYGDGLPLGTVFKSREPAGEALPPECWSEADPRDLILTRILHLRGLEQGFNLGPGIDSFERFIYIHGTNHENLLGAPASHGCIRMGNRDVSTLFNLVRDLPVWCWIHGGSAT
jgi:hypothetical protein